MEQNLDPFGVQPGKFDMYAQLDKLQQQLIPQAPTSTPLQNPNLIMPTPPPGPQPGAAPQPGVNPKMMQRPQQNGRAYLERINRQMHPPTAPQAAPGQPAPPPTPPSRQGILYKPGKAPNRHFSWGI